MKKLATLAALMAITLSSQAADLYLYAGAGLKEPVEKIVKQFEQKYDTYEPLDETEERMSGESTPFDSASSIDQDLNIENQIGFDLNKLNEPAKAPQLDEYNDLSSKERAIIELKNMNIDVENNDFDIPVHNPDKTDIEAELELTRSDADEEGEDSGDGDALLDALRSGKLDTDR